MLLELKQAPLPSALPPSITQQSSQSSTQLQVENISPAPPTTTKTPATTVGTEPSRPTQSVDTSFSNSSSSVPKPPNITQSSIATMAQYTNSGATYGTTLSSGVPLVTVGSYMPNLHYPAAQGLHMGAMYTSQAYPPPAQGLTQPIQYQQSQLQLPPQPPGFSAPLQPGGTMYGIPPRSLGNMQNPQGGAMGMGQSPMRAPPPLPPMPPNIQPVQHPQGRADFSWPRQFGAPPSQNQGMRGGWMPR